MVAFQYRKYKKTLLEQRTFSQNKQKQKKTKNKNKTKTEGNIQAWSNAGCYIKIQKKKTKNFLKIDYVDN